MMAAILVVALVHVGVALVWFLVVVHDDVLVFVGVDVVGLFGDDDGVAGVGCGVVMLLLLLFSCVCVAAALSVQCFCLVLLLLFLLVLLIF